MEATIPKQRILIVDDSPINVAILGEVLSAQYDIQIATNGRDALENVESATLPDLILLDIMMPGMNGYEVCRSLKASERTRHIPVIFVTAKDEEADEERGFALGAVDYIIKPISIPIVKARVATHLALFDQNRSLEQMVRQRTLELTATQDATIRSMAILAEYRDNETGGHIIRTQHYILILAEKLRDRPRFRDTIGSPEALDLLFKSAPLHDIGKVAIPDHILLKPGPMTTEEFEIMKLHTVYGFEALAKAEKSLSDFCCGSSFLSLARVS